MILLPRTGALIEDAKTTSQDRRGDSRASTAGGLAAFISPIPCRREVDCAHAYECEAKAAHRCGREVCYRDEQEDVVKEINEITGGKVRPWRVGPGLRTDAFGLISDVVSRVSSLSTRLNDQPPTVPPLALISKILTIQGTTSGPQRKSGRQMRQLDFVINVWEKGTLNQFIDRVLFRSTRLSMRTVSRSEAGQFGEIVAQFDRVRTGGEGSNTQ